MEPYNKKFDDISDEILELEENGEFVFSPGPKIAEFDDVFLVRKSSSFANGNFVNGKNILDFICEIMPKYNIVIVSKAWRNDQEYFGICVEDRFIATRKFEVRSLLFKIDHAIHLEKEVA